MSKNLNKTSKDFTNFLKTAINSIDPAKLIQNTLKIKHDHSTKKDYLLISNKFLFKNNNQDTHKTYELNKNVYVAAFGKAALGMSIEIEKLIGSEHIVKGIAIIPYNDASKFIKDSNKIHPVTNSKINYYYGGKFNLPDSLSREATQKLYDMCFELKSDDLLIALISGGGSALLTLPENIIGTNDIEKNHEVKLKTIKQLVSSGVNINELNTVRSCLSLVKGGKLALCAYPAQIISLIISDVIDDPLEIISSGPCCVDLVNSQKDQAVKAIKVLEKYDLMSKISKEVLEFLNKKLNNEIFLESKEEEFLKNERVFNYLIGNNKYATEAILNKADNLDYDFKIILTNSLDGEAKLVGFLYACLAFFLIELKLKQILVKNSLELIRQKYNKDYVKIENLLKKFLTNIFDLGLNEDLLKRSNLKMCLISGGETTVDMRDVRPGKGGRNQEMTLAFEIYFQQLNFEKNFDLLFTSFGSDGIDGPTDAAGAYYLYDKNFIFDSDNYNHMITYLNDHNSYNYFDKNNRLIKTGPTGTNVSDLQFMLINFEN